MKPLRPAFNLDVTSLEAVDSVCIRFEDLLREGQEPCALDVLSAVPPEQTPALLGELLALESEYLPHDTCNVRITRYRQELPHLASVLDGAVLCNSLPRGTVPKKVNRIGNYTVVERVGQGAFGTVYLALDSRNGQRVALKTAIVNSSRQSDSIDREVRLLRRLAHPVIIELLDTVRDNNTVTMVTPFLEGGTLRQHLQSARIDLVHFVRRLIPLVDGIAYVHTQGIVHRDIEPGNILLRNDGEFVLSDFGLAIHESEQPKANGESAGSMAYMSPEQVRGESHWLDGRADIWAIGVVLYECLTGKRPFPSNDHLTLTDEILYKPIRPPRQVNPEICSKLEEICLRCLARDTNQRCATAKDLSSQLSVWLRDRRSGQNSRFRPRYFFAAIAIVASTIFFLVWPSYFGGDEADQNRRSSGIRIETEEDREQDVPAVLDKKRDQLWPLRDSHERFAFHVDRDNEFFDIDSQHVLPLRPDDELWILGTPPEEWSVFAFLVDSSGSVHYLSPPEDAIAWRQIPRGAKGSEAIVLISSIDSLDAQTTKSRFPPLAEQSQTVSRDTVRFINGSPTSRSTQHSTTSELPAMYTNQLRIAEAFRDSGCHVHALVYGVAGPQP